MQLAGLARQSLYQQQVYLESTDIFEVLQFWSMGMLSMDISRR